MADTTNCPICGKRTVMTARSAPFCSARCQQIDLGNWLGERYVVPGSPAEHPIADEDPPVDGGR